MAAGILDFLQTPAGMGLLSAAAGYASGARRGTPVNNIGRGLLGGLAGYGQALEQQDQISQRAKANELRDLQLAQAKQAAEEKAAQRSWLASQNPSLLAGQSALAGGGGPTIENAAKVPPVNPQQQKLWEAANAGVIPASDFINTFKPKEPKYTVVDGNLVRTDTDKPEVAFTAPTKPEAAPSSVREYEFARSQGYGGTYEQWATSQKRAGASNTNLSVNTGQKGLDNELKIRSDFRSEPTYRAHNEVVAAHNQITQSLKMGTPAGDLAGATKIMKILDPNSVVRESELAMAMAATGSLDRLANYADMVVKGTKLTPNQRKDFQNLADKLYAESERQYNAKRDEYSALANDYGLNADRILGKTSKVGGATGSFGEEKPDSAAPVATMRWNPKTRKIEAVN